MMATMDFETDAAPVQVGFFCRSVDEVAASLIGCWLVAKTDRGFAGGRIVETEAYCQNDPAAHCYNPASPGQPKVTKMNRAMFCSTGHLHVYPNSEKYCHLNIVCRPPSRIGEFGSAVLIRAIAPTINIEQLRRSRAPYFSKPYVALSNDRKICSGPIMLCQALGITHCDYNGRLLGETNLMIYQNVTVQIPIHHDRRIGVPNEWPRRYLWKGCRYLSKAAQASIEIKEDWLAELAAIQSASEMSAFFSVK